jgi:hypothetical protein
METMLSNLAQYPSPYKVAQRQELSVPNVLGNAPLRVRSDQRNFIGIVQVCFPLEFFPLEPFDAKERVVPIP